MRKVISIATMWLLALCVYAQNHVPTIQLDGITYPGEPGSQAYFTGTAYDEDNDNVEINVFAVDVSGEHHLISTFNTIGSQAGTPFQENYNILVPISFAYLYATVTDNHPVSIEDIVAEVSQDSLEAYMSFVEGIRHRTGGLDHLNEVKDSLLNHFAAKGLATRTQDWSYGGYAAQNLLGKQWGIRQPNNMFINDAHFDSVINAPGADDNGSGTVGVMEAVRVLSRYRFNKSIQFIGFDLEEMGLVGSIRYVTQPDGLQDWEQLEAVLNFEMIGYYSDQPNTQEVPAGFNLLFPAATSMIQQDSSKGNFITNVGLQSGQALIDTFRNSAATYVPNLRVIDLAAPGTSTIAPDLRRSDHTPFWDSGYPALMLTDGSEFRNNNYHTPSDVSDSLNFEFMTNTVKATVATLAALAGPVSSSWDTTSVEFFLIPTTDPIGQTWQLLPNPVRDVLQLTTTTAVMQPVTCHITDAQGRTVKATTLPAATSHSLDVSSLPSGIYQLVLTERGNPLLSRSFVKE